MKAYDSLALAMNALKEKGFNYDFDMSKDCIKCEQVDKEFKPDEFEIIEVHRFEGMSNPDDNSILFAIKANDGTKGLLVDAYGVYAETITPELAQKLKFKIDGRR